METETVNRPATPPAIQRSTTSWIGTIALIILLIGGLNWALVGLFSFDLVAALFGAMTTASRAVYVIVGIAAVYAIFLLPRVSRVS